MNTATNPPIATGQAAPAGEERLYLTFLLNKEMFALGIINIKEIIEYGGLTEVPMMPSFICGVINLRGSVVPVMDLAARFGHERTQVSKRTCIVIIEVSGAEAKHDIGVMVDSVSEVLEIPQGEIEPPPTFGAKIRVDFIQGMGKVNGKFVIILNADKVLSADVPSMPGQAAGAIPAANSTRLEAPIP